MMYFCPWRLFFILANSADPDEMPKYMSTDIQNEKGQIWSIDAASLILLNLDACRITHLNESLDGGGGGFNIFKKLSTCFICISN